MRIEAGDEFVEEVSVCIFISPRPTSHENPPPGTWVMLQNSTNIFQYEAVKWEGYLELRAGTQLGAWFRGAKEGDVLELNAIWDVEVIGNGEPLQNGDLTKEWDESGLGKVAQC